MTKLIVAALAAGIAIASPIATYAAVGSAFLLLGALDLICAAFGRFTINENTETMRTGWCHLL